MWWIRIGLVLVWIHGGLAWIMERLDDVGFLDWFGMDVGFGFCLGFGFLGLGLEYGIGFGLG